MKKNISSSESRGIWAWDIVKIVTILSLVIYFAIIYLNGFDEKSNRLLIRLTATTGVFLFGIAFGASAFHRWQKNSFSWWLFMNRKFFGISFAILHLLHLIFLLLLQKNFHPVFEKAANISLISGGLAYLFLVLMLLTSFDFFSKKISRQSWKILHTAGGYWIWLIFMISYTKRVDTEIEYLPQVLFLAFVLMLRIWKFKF